MGLLIFVVLAVCGTPELPTGKWQEISAFSTQQKANDAIDLNYNTKCSYSVHAVKVDAVKTEAEPEPTPEPPVNAPAAQ